MLRNLGQGSDFRGGKTSNSDRENGWDSKGIIHYGSLPLVKMIDFGLYCQPLTRVQWAMEKKLTETIEKEKPRLSPYVQVFRIPAKWKELA